MSREQAEMHMKKVIEQLHQEFGAVRTGRASAALLEGLKVEYYGAPSSVNQLANISAVDGRTLEIKPWDKEGLQAIEQAILKSDLGLSPQSDGKIIRLTLPTPTMDRRKELTRMIKKQAEDFRVKVRNIRRDSVEELKKQEKEKKISQDDLRRSEQEIQKITDHYVKSIDNILANKEKEILEV